MRTTRIFLAAVAATLLSASAFAAAPTTAQVSVPAGAEMSKHESKMRALFSSPEEQMMFRMQMREAVHGMTRAQKKVYRHKELQRIRAMNDSEKASWRHDLDAKWSALPAERRERIAARMQRREERHESHMERRHGGQDMNPQQPPQRQ